MISTVETDRSRGQERLAAYGVYVGKIVARLFILAGVWTRPWAAL